MPVVRLHFIHELWLSSAGYLAFNGVDYHARPDESQGEITLENNAARATHMEQRQGKSSASAHRDHADRIWRAASIPFLLYNHIQRQAHKIGKVRAEA